MSSKRPSHRHPNVDVCSAAHAVLEALPAIAVYRDRAARLSEFDVRCFDTLATSATNAIEASRHLDDVRIRTDLAVDPRVSLVASLRAERDVLRAVLAVDATDGISTDLMVDSIFSGRTDKELAHHVLLLCELGFELLSAGRTMPPADAVRLARVNDLAMQLDALCRQASPEKTIDAGTRCRDTAFARLATQYAEVRRAIEYLRPRDIELNTIAPSLYEKRGAKTRTRIDTLG